MRATKLITAIMLLFVSLAASAQEYNPFKSIGKKGKILTLSKGKYVEVFDYDTIQRIGTVLFNIRTKKVVKLLNSEEINKKFSDNSSTSRWYSPDPLAYLYFSYSPYNFTLNNPIKNIDPDGRLVVGATKEDAKKAQDDVLSYFRDDKFAGLRGLINIKGKKFEKIDGKTLDATLKDVKMTDDEKALVDMVTGAINSKDVHTVEFAKDGENISDGAISAFAVEYKKLGIDLEKSKEVNGGVSTRILSAFGGAGLTTTTDNGTYSVIIEGMSPASYGTDYVNTATGVAGTNMAGRAATTGHEIFGHGRSLALGRGASAQHFDAIRTENLILRVMGFGTTQRDGTGHAHGEKIAEPSKLPGF